MTRSPFRGYLIFLIILIPFIGFSQTYVSGTLTTDTEWTASNSPYVLTSTVGVNSGITLTVSAGVEIQGDFDLLVKGSIIINGTSADSVSLDQTRLIFKESNLSNSSIEYVILRNNSTLQLSDNDSDNNTNTLSISHLLVSNSRIVTKGYASGASLEIHNARVLSSTIQGDYPNSETIRLIDSQIENSSVYSYAYNLGIFIVRSEITNSNFASGCCGANINIRNSVVSESSFSQADDSSPGSTNELIISNSRMTNSYVDMPVSTVNISGSIWTYNDDFSGSFCVVSGNGTIENTSFIGNGTLIAVERGPAFFNYQNKGAFNITGSSFENFEIAIKINDGTQATSGNGPVTISTNDFYHSSQYHLMNASGYDIDAQQNYWSSTDDNVIANSIYDELDDINSGLVDYSNYLSSASHEVPISAPQNVFKGLQDNGVIITWEAVDETDLAGYKIFSKELETDDYTLLVDVGNVSSFLTDQVSITDFIAVSAYNSDADGDSDFREGNESDYSNDAENYLTDVVLSSSEVCQDELLEVNLNSNYSFSGNEFILQLSDIDGSFEDAVDLDNITTITETLSSTLPNTLQYGASYWIRVFSTELNVFSASYEVIPYGIPTSSFDLETVVCAGETTTITYTGTGSSDAAYNWDFDGATIVSGSGQGPYVVSWEDDGDKTVSLDVTENGCTSEVTENTTYQNPEVEASFSTNPIICQGENATITFDGTAPEGTVFNWDLDGGTIVSDNSTTLIEVAWADLGQKSVSLSLELNGCSASSTAFTIDYNTIPTSSFDLETVVCAGETTTITYTGTGSSDASYNWDFDGATIVSGSGQGPYVVSWEDVGDKTVSLDVTENGCTSEVTENTTYQNPEVEASFSTDPIICQGENATITFDGTAPEGTVFNWDLDGGTIVSDNSTTLIEVAWDDLGQKSVSLSLELNGCTASSTAFTIDYNTIPTSSFDLETVVCAGETTTITYTGTGSSDAAYNWDFDGATIVSGSGQGPYVVSWEDDGDKTVSLDVTENGCTSEVTENTTYQNPEVEASFSTNPIICQGENATITFDGTAPEGTVFNWDLDGGTIVSDNSTTLIEVAWADLGRKSVSLSLELNGCSASSTAFTIDYNTIPTSSFDLETVVCAGETTTITYTGTGSSDASYNWDFDGATIVSGSGQGPYVVSWEDVGDKTVSLDVTENGCTSEVTENTTYQNPEVEASFSTDPIICQGENATITFDGTAPEGTVFNWDLDGGTIVSDNSTTLIEVAWDDLGQKSVSLSLELNGCTTSSTAFTIDYNTIPTSSFDLETVVCAGETTTITYTGTGSSDASYNWDFDGATIVSGSGQGPYEVYWETGGNKSVTLVVTENGCASQNNSGITLPEFPNIPNICLVTVDDETAKNMLVWKSEDESVSQFGIYRESNVAGEFLLIEYVPSDSLNTYIDTQSSPEQQANRYRITSVDSCGYETGFSSYHKTIHLSIYQFNDNWNLIWDGYDGFDFGTYKIYRSLNGGNFNHLADIASNLNSFTDLDVPSSDVAYRIEAVSPDNCNVNIEGRTDFASKSNIARHDLVLHNDVVDLELEVFPNPATDFITIRSQGLQIEKYELMNVAGKIVGSGNLEGVNTIGIHGYSTGVYLLKIQTNEGMTLKRIIKK